MTDLPAFTHQVRALVAEGDEPDVPLDTLRALVEVPSQRPSGHDETAPAQPEG